MLMSGPSLREKYALLLTCESIPRLDQDRDSTLTFVGGFEKPEIALDHSKDSTFLALAYPTAGDFSELEAQIGSIDLMRTDAPGEPGGRQA